MKIVITLSVKTASNLQEKIQGFIGKDMPYGLLIKTHFGIHTFGVKFPIDVLILNNKNIVVALKQNIKPNRIFLWNPIYETVVELPTGTIKQKAIEIKSQVRLSP